MVTECGLLTARHRVVVMQDYWYNKNLLCTQTPQYNHGVSIPQNTLEYMLTVTILLLQCLVGIIVTVNSSVPE